MQTPTFLSARSPSVAAAVDAAVAAADDPAAVDSTAADDAAGAADDAVVAAVLPHPASNEIDIAAAVSRQTNFFFITCTPLKLLLCGSLSISPDDHRVHLYNQDYINALLSKT